VELTSCQLGEGLFIKDDGSLWWLDINRQLLLTSDAKWAGLYKLPEPASKVLSVRPGEVILASTSGLCSFLLNTGEFIVKQSAPALSWKGKGSSRANDACVIPDGRVLVGRMLLRPKNGSGDIVEYVESKVRVIATECAIPNTFVYLSDINKVLISDSLAKVTYAVSVEEGQQKRIFDHEVWHDFSDYPGTPDGGVLASDGYVYLAMWGAGAILKLTPSGVIVNEIKVSALQPTSIQESTITEELISTSAVTGMSKNDLEKYPASGQIIRVPL